MRWTWTMMALAISTALAAPISAQEITHTTEPIDKVKAKVESKKAILADVREGAEWKKGHVEGAVLIPLSDLARWEKHGITDADKTKLARTLPKGTVVYCHCAAGARALAGAEILTKLGYDARALKPGYSALIEAGFRRDRSK